MQTPDNRFSALVTRCIDCSVTLVCWAWFTFGFLIFFSWRYLFFALFTKYPELSFQRMNSQYNRIFYRVVRETVPRQRIEVGDEVAKINSSVIVCNHLSYLDPLLLITLFPKHRTIVKSRFFTMPIFGWMIKKSGYIPSTSEGPFARIMIRQMETMESYLKAGGNLFIFPEGTRSRDGQIGRFNNGAFKIARMCRAPIYVLQLRNSDRLFTPGKFLFNTRMRNTIDIQIIGHIDPDYQNNPPSTAKLEAQVRQSYSETQL